MPFGAGSRAPGPAILGLPLGRPSGNDDPVSLIHGKSASHINKNFINLQTYLAALAPGPFGPAGALSASHCPSDRAVRSIPKRFRPAGAIAIAVAPQTTARQPSQNAAASMYTAIHFSSRHRGLRERIVSLLEPSVRPRFLVFHQAGHGSLAGAGPDRRTSKTGRPANPAAVAELSPSTITRREKLVARPVRACTSEVRLSPRRRSSRWIRSPASTRPLLPTRLRRATDRPSPMRPQNPASDWRS
jgi:hypothetical protein